ncbi:acyl-CoA thioesterase [Sporosarcina sp. FSL W7-1283]|uniref:acyl-CoA thioesterase n=1 Tax=Sporosarcina sp. FSL W7-1283 TaxID=2921560 RepID=UPI0030F589B5
MKASYIEDLDKWKEDFQFFSEVSVRFSETDMYGHLNNTSVFTYFEYARIEYFKSLNCMEKWMNPKGETIPIVADLQCDYRKQVFFDEKLRVFVKTQRMGNSSMDLHYMGKNEHDEIVFTGRGTVVQINRKSGQPVTWSEEELEVYLQNS